MASPSIRYISPEQYLAIERQATTKSQYHAGEMFAMAGASHEHSLIVGNVSAGLHNAFRGRACQVHSSDLRLQVSATGLYTYPDILAFCGQPNFVDDQFDTLTNPQLLIEVLSDSTESFDRGAKFGHYRTIESLREYVMISQYEPRVERFLRNDDGEWVLKEWTSLDDTVELESVACRLAMGDIYERVQFPPRTESGLLQNPQPKPEGN